MVDYVTPANTMSGSNIIIVGAALCVIAFAAIIGFLVFNSMREHDDEK